MTDIQFGRGVLDGPGCVSTAWELIKRRYGLYLGVTLLTIIITTWLYCISWVLLGPIMAGLYYIVSRDLDDQPIEFGMMFKGFEKFVPLMFVGLIQAIPRVFAQILSLFFNVASIFLPQNGNGRNGFGSVQSNFAPNYAPEIAGGVMIVIALISIVVMLFFIAWAITFYFAIPLTFEYDLSPIDAIKLSARAGWANVGGIIVLSIMAVLVSLLGMLMLCIGIILVSLPVTMVAYAVAYRQVFPRPIERNLNYNPPSPDQYGGFYGSAN